MPRFCSIYLVSFFQLFIHFSFSQVKDSNLAVTNAHVYQMHRDGNTLYMQGFFTKVIPRIGKGAIIDTGGTGQIIPNMPKVKGKVFGVISDGAGGWYIGGDFTKVGNATIKNLAHILPDKSIENWRPEPNRPVRSLALSGTTLYVGGEFTSIGSQSRSMIAAVNTVTGNATSFNTVLNDMVWELEVVNNILFVNGNFNLVNGTPKLYYAALDASTGSFSSFNPTFNGFPTCFAARNNVIYIGGDFTEVNGTPRRYVAAFDAATGDLTSWNPNLDPLGEGVYSTVKSIFPDGNKVYLGGSFQYVGASRRLNAACVDAVNGTATNWNPAPNDEVNTIMRHGSKVYIGGSFSRVGSNINNWYLVATDTVNGNVSAWNPSPDNTILKIAAHGKEVYVAGDYDFIGSYERNYLAAVDLTSGMPTSWNPMLNVGSSNGIILTHDTMVYVAGGYTTIGGFSRTKLAAIGKNSGVPTPWNPEIVGSVAEMVIYNNQLYVSNVASVNGQARNSMCSFDLSTGNLTSFNPNINGQVYAFAFYKNKIYLAGSFTQVEGLPRKKLAAIDLSTNQVTSWNPDAPDQSIQDMVVWKDLLCVGGNFTKIGNIPRQNLAFFDLKSTGSLALFNYKINGSIMSMAVGGNTLHIGGTFTTVGSQLRNKTAAIDLESFKVLPFQPVLDGLGNSYENVYKVLVQEGSVYYGGLYSYTSGNNSLGNVNAYNNFPLTFNTNKVTGMVYNDADGNCSRGSGEAGVKKQMLIEATPGPYYASTDSNGEYDLYLPVGNFSLKVLENESFHLFYQKECGNTKNFMLTANQDLAGQDFGLKELSCTMLKVDVSSNRRRRCFRNITTVQYCNQGTRDAASAVLKITFPESVIPISSSIPWSSKNGNELTYNLTSIPAESCNSIIIIDSVVCEVNLRGVTICTKATIAPSNSCKEENPAWDKSSIQVSGTCNTGAATFLIENHGSGNMADSSEFRVYFDNVLGYKNTFKLVSGEVLSVYVTTHGATIRLEADQHPLHPGRSRPRATVENCTGNAQTIALSRVGFPTQVPIDNWTEDENTSCMEIIDSYDPNDKQVQPSGVTAYHYITDEDLLEYTIRFQNTGTDTAYTVIITDTLDQHLDISTLNVIGGSHSYITRVKGEGKPFIEWTFPKINLPDSTRNKFTSNGFVKFRINQKLGNAHGTTIRNKAYIYFDYNEPVITNEPTVMVWDSFPVDFSNSGLVFIGSLTGVNNLAELSKHIKLIPNPFKDQAVLKINVPSFESLTFELSNLQGKILLKGQIENSQYELKKGDLMPGIYMYRLHNQNGVIYTGKAVVE